MKKTIVIMAAMMVLFSIPAMGYHLSEEAQMNDTSDEESIGSLIGQDTGNETFSNFRLQRLATDQQELEEYIQMNRIQDEQGLERSLRTQFTLANDAELDLVMDNVGEDMFVQMTRTTEDNAFTTNANVREGFTSTTTSSNADGFANTRTRTSQTGNAGYDVDNDGDMEIVVVLDGEAIRPASPQEAQAISVDLQRNADILADSRTSEVRIQTAQNIRNR